MDTTTTTEALVGEIVTVHSEPYGTYRMRVTEAGTYGTGKTVTGIVTEGTERSFLMGHSSSRDITGERRTVYGVTPQEIERREFRRIAM